jgi:hypothetical protein
VLGLLSRAVRLFFVAVGLFFRILGLFLRVTRPFFRALGLFFRALGPFLHALRPFFRALGLFFPAMGPFFRALGLFFHAMGLFFHAMGLIFRAVGLFFRAMRLIFRVLGLFFCAAGPFRLAMTLIHLATRQGGGHALLLNNRPTPEPWAADAVKQALRLRDRMNATDGQAPPFVRAVLCLPHVALEPTPTPARPLWCGNTLVCNEQTLIETLEQHGDGLDRAAVERLKAGLHTLMNQPAGRTQ